MLTFKLLLAGGLAAGALALPAPAMALSASPAGSGAGYGQHVATCAKAMGGFAGEHNPGMHHGRSGWDGMTCMPTA